MAAKTAAGFALSQAGPQVAYDVRQAAIDLTEEALLTEGVQPILQSAYAEFAALFERQRQAVLAAMDMMGPPPNYEEIPPEHRAEKRRPVQKATADEIRRWLDELLARPELDDEALAQAIRPYLEAGLQVGADSANRRTPPALRVTWNMRNRDAERFLLTHPIEFARQVSDTTNEQIRATLAAGMGRGETWQELRQRVNTVLGGNALVRAELIALTETNRAVSMGQLNYWGNTGLERVQFTAAMDERTCDVCGPLHTESWYQEPPRLYTMDEAASIIPLHPRCRCYWTPWVDETVVEAEPEQPLTDEAAAWEYVERALANAGEDRETVERAIRTLVEGGEIDAALAQAMPVIQEHGYDRDRGPAASLPKVFRPLYTRLHEMLGTSQGWVDQQVMGWAGSIRHAVPLRYAVSKIERGLTPEEWAAGEWFVTRDLRQTAINQTATLTAEGQRAVLGEVALTRYLLRRLLGRDTVALYRGLGGDIGRQIRSLGSGQTVQIGINNLSSWTTDRSVAETFGVVVLEKDAPLDQVVQTFITHPGFLWGGMREAEVILSHPYQTITVTLEDVSGQRAWVAKEEGMKPEFLGHADSGDNADWLHREGWAGKRRQS